MANGVKFGRKPKLSDYQRQEAIKRRAAGETLASIAKTLHLVTACSDYERFHGRTPEQAKQACEPQRQTSEACARTLDK
jgi:hypothetical protein